jgi:hypothetical protein
VLTKVINKAHHDATVKHKEIISLYINPFSIQNANFSKHLFWCENEGFKRQPYRQRVGGEGLAWPQLNWMDGGWGTQVPGRLLAEHCNTKTLQSHKNCFTAHLQTRPLIHWERKIANLNNTNLEY